MFAENKKIVLDDGFVFDYATMMGEGRVTEADLEEFLPDALRAARAVESLRSDGIVRGHLSKDGEAEHVYFTRLPYVQAGNPNDDAVIDALEELSAFMRSEVDAVIFLGVGGSYLGNKVLFDVFGGESWNTLTDAERDDFPRIFFGGNNLDPSYCRMLARQINSLALHGKHKEKKFTVALVPISKSGTTLETLTSFSYFYGEFSKNTDLQVSVAVVTDLRDEAASPLARLAQSYAWRSFDIKEGVGGRFSVLHTPGLVTAAALGLDIRQLLAGAAAMDGVCAQAEPMRNPALLNACLKYLAAEKYGCDIEVFMPYGMSLKSLAEWYIQLLAESLGKRRDRDGRCVFYGRTPVAAVGSTDMHAQTQQHQDGKRNKVVQFLRVAHWDEDFVLDNPFAGEGAFAKYRGLKLGNALNVALAANREALDGDGRFSAVYELPRLNAYYLGEIFYFLMLSVAYEGELANVDAYDQPGVETYKKIMKQKLAQF